MSCQRTSAWRTRGPAGVAALAVFLTPLGVAAETTAELPEVSYLSIVALVGVPLFLVLASAFLKVAIVLGLLRGAFGSADVPPPMVVTALAVLISIIVLSPVASETASRVEGNPQAPQSIAEAQGLWEQLSPPMLSFLERNASPDSVERFAEIVGVAPEDKRLDVLLAAFVSTELTEAFQIAFLLLLPFLVLDLIVASFLQAAGLAGVQPTVVSLPLKILLFVAIDGWQLLLEGLLLGYS